MLRATGVIAAISIAASACSDHKTPEAVVTPRTQVEVRLTASDTLPAFQIQAYFDAAVEPRTHVQPLTAAIAAARAACAGKQGTAAVMKLTMHSRHVGVGSGDGSCLASALDASAIDDPAEYTVDLVVRVGV